ncbi:S8 family peptidase [Actinomadura sp. HBU206391]|uniref:S8 family peptidase n=1 Tax=Actinomadura sp. HBU206391 TaxID=2731692 RepID=UPI00164FDE97|nr:S8 family peptidase [Actinomadura sp. HBU206391]MBC6457432.1 S8 family peptidase [Actinomadura sp. HBU206391]
MRAASRRLLIASAVAASVGVATTVFVASQGPRLVQVAAADDEAAIPGQYIVTLKRGASVPTTASQGRIATLQRFDKVLNGFAAKLNSEQLNRLRRDPAVAAIEQDQIAKISTTQRSPLPWGLDRIDEGPLPLSKSYTYKASGTGVNAYVIDTGIYPGHADFGGRAKVAYDALGGDGQDCNGHGTHVAGIIGSKTYGVAKTVKLWGVRALDCDGTAPYSKIITAVNWVQRNAEKPAVANMSLGGSKSTALNTAVTNLSKSGVFLAVAAGNDNTKACNGSPASAGWVEAVGATISNDTRASFSNYGSCVDMQAPGSSIWSTYIGGPTAHQSMSGTSMASPYVAGVAALYKSAKGEASFPTIQKWMSDNATKNRVKKLPTGTPNRLIYKSTL